MLFGCGKRPASKEGFADIPHFPETDSPAVAVTPVPMEPGFSPQTFLLHPEHSGAFVLAHHPGDSTQQALYHLLFLNSNGQVQAKTTFRKNSETAPPLLWWEEHQRLALLIDHDIRTFDPATLKEISHRRYLNFSNFLTKNQRDQLTYNEQNNAYRQA